ncbi:MAG: Fic family protein [Nanoarchaeota archaeon]
MSYLVKQTVKGHEYFYLVKNQRQEHGWSKCKLYLGKQAPDNVRLRAYENELEAKARNPQRIRTARKLQKHAFLSKEEISTLESTRKSSVPEINEKNDIDFLIRFTFNSNKIEGSTMTLLDTKLVIEDEIAPSGKKLREIYEAKNMEAAYSFVKNYEKDLSRKFILTTHRMLMDHIIPDAGGFRKKRVKITGSEFLPPKPEDLDEEMDRFLSFYRFIKKKYHPVEVASLVHIKFVQLHPFTDGNGRVARLLLNFVLMKNGYLPLIIKDKNKEKYYTLLESTHEEKDYLSFIRFVYECLKEEYI